ncbi:MAG: XdhC family protein, partial [Kofleriaceae bacterium]
GLDEESLARVLGPAGLDLGCKTPEEIAISIAAELIALRRRGAPAAGDWRPVRAAASEPREPAEGEP